MKTVLKSILFCMSRKTSSNTDLVGVHFDNFIIFFSNDTHVCFQFREPILLGLSSQARNLPNSWEG